MPNRLPESLGAPKNYADRVAVAETYKKFCFGVLDVVGSMVPAVKPQAAFFEQLGPCGMTVLGEVIAYARQKGLLVILDGKRNDIGSTASAYAEGILGEPEESGWGADAITVSPYLGEDSLDPFFDVAQKRSAGAFVLVKTSNPGGGMLQDLAVEGKNDLPPRGRVRRKKRPKRRRAIAVTVWPGRSWERPTHSNSSNFAK